MTIQITSRQAPPEGRFLLDPTRSAVRFTSRHLFGLGLVHGTIAIREAELVVSDPPAKTTLRAVLDAATFNTGLGIRDSAVRSRFYLDTKTYPDVTFASENAHLVGDTWLASGGLTAHGLVAPVDIRLVDFNSEADELTIHASSSVDRYAHGVVATKGLASRWLAVDISAVLRRVTSTRHEGG